MKWVGEMVVVVVVPVVVVVCNGVLGGNASMGVGKSFGLAILGDDYAVCAIGICMKGLTDYNIIAASRPSS